MDYKEFQKFLIDGVMEMELPIGINNYAPVLNSSLINKNIDPNTGEPEVTEDTKSLDENGWKK